MQPYPREGYLQTLYPELHDLLSKFIYECNFSVFVLDATLYLGSGDRLLDIVFNEMHILINVQRNHIGLTTIPGILSLTTADTTYQEIILEFVRSVQVGIQSILTLSPSTLISYYQGSFTIRTGDDMILAPLPVCRQLIEALASL